MKKFPLLIALTASVFVAEAKFDFKTLPKSGGGASGETGTEAVPVAEPAATGRFVFFDSQRTGFPVFAVEMPSGWTALCRFTWLADSLRLAKYSLVAGDPSDGSRMTIGSPFTIQPVGIGYHKLADAADLTDPQKLALRFRKEMIDLYDLSEVKGMTATFRQYPEDEAQRFLADRLPRINGGGMKLTAYRYGIVRIRYAAKAYGRNLAVNLFLTYFPFELNGATSFGEIVGFDSCCSTPEREPELIKRLVAFTDSRENCEVFDKYVDRVIKDGHDSARLKPEEIRKRFERICDKEDIVPDEIWTKALGSLRLYTHPDTGAKCVTAGGNGAAWVGENGDILYRPAGAQGFAPNAKFGLRHTNWSALQ